MDFKYSVENEESCRLDYFLSDVSDFSRNKIKNTIISGNVKVNNEIVRKPSFKLKLGDSIDVSISIEKDTTLQQQTNNNLDIIYEDDYLLVINKPAFLVCHPGVGNPDSTLANYVFGYLGKFPYLVHRLDKDTSGVIVFAKDEDTLNKLQKMWKDREVDKYYKALTVKTPSSREGLIDSPLRRDTVNRQKIRISAHDIAREAKTHFEVIDVFEEYALLDIQIYTGRTHQIRVHLSSIGCPVAGDNVYGNSKENAILKEEFGLNRQFLHAYKLEFIHPYTGEKMIFKADIAKDLAEVVKKLKIGN